MSKINENYHGEVYHFTSLVQASWIIHDNCLYPNLSQSEENDGRTDNRKYASDEYAEVISFTRDKRYNIQQDENASSVCFVFDGDELQKIRMARLYPFAFSGRGEAEERLYNVCVKPLNKYVKRIEINLKHGEGCWMSDRGYDEEDELYDTFSEKYPGLQQAELDEKIQKYLVKKMLRSTRFAGKILVKDNAPQKPVQINEEQIKKIVSEALKRLIK